MKKLLARFSAVKKKEKGINLIGYPRHEFGMGEHVRMTAAALNYSGTKYNIFDFSHGPVARNHDFRFEKYIDNTKRLDLNIFHINADQISRFNKKVGSSFIKGSYNIGYWFWELPLFPRQWKKSANMMQEIWAPTHFIKDAIKPLTNAPVVYMPPPVCVQSTGGRFGREELGLPVDKFIFYFNFDFASYVTRKNPDALINAYKQANIDDSALVIKTISHERYPEQMNALLESLSGCNNVFLINDTLDLEHHIGIMEHIDCYVSLHRSEGFGRGMAEAMALGKPVIATRFSGNLDFMNDNNSLLVDCGMVDVQEGEYLFSRDQYWAEPDVEHAAYLMKKIFQDSTLRETISRNASAFMEKEFSLRNISRQYMRRLSILGYK